MFTNEPFNPQKNRRTESVNNRHMGGFFLVQNRNLKTGVSPWT